MPVAIKKEKGARRRLYYTKSHGRSNTFVNCTLQKVKRKRKDLKLRFLRYAVQPFDAYFYGAVAAFNK